jgi:hypothetical protein
MHLLENNSNNNNNNNNYTKRRLVPYDSLFAHGTFQRESNLSLLSRLAQKDTLLDLASINNMRLKLNFRVPATFKESYNIKN